MSPLALQRHLSAWSVLYPGLADPIDFGTRGDGVRDDDGILGPRTRRALAAAQAALGTSFATQADLLAALRPAPAVMLHRVLGRALGERALAHAFLEWLDGVQEQPKGSNGGPRIAEYFSICDRAGRPVTMRAGEWCAASASWCLERGRRIDEKLPHGFRVSGAELVTDLKERGRWRPLEDVRRGRYVPGAGDLVILARDGGWTRHVCRLVAMRGQYLWTLGGNEGDEWRLTPRRLGDARLLGLGAYPR